MHVLKVINLTKQFKDFVAVDNISFSLQKGEILGFLGPNGAGKTTTIQMLLGILTPSHGHISYFGKEFNANREEILEKLNFSSTYTNLPWVLTVKENLTYTAHLYDIQDRKQRVKHIIKTFRLEELQNKPISDLSAGQQTRVNLAKSFINDPEVVLLDEPTASLDPETARFIREYILHKREKDGISVLFTSHNMKEVEEVTDRVLFINHGKIIANDTPLNLAKSLDTTQLSLTLAPDHKEKLIVFAHQKNIPIKVHQKSVILFIKDSQTSSILNEIVKQRIVFADISIERPSLEDYFLKVAGNTPGSFADIV
ncbi:ABC transporter ATP-binding protein [Candidatus Woesebacteria bacterium]|nr:ABC transporter ATP-binding protein [Candidatus Woesebacteria bacterium]